MPPPGALGSSGDLASAGPNAGGTLILHANTSLVYTEENEGYCGQSGLTSCEQAVTTMPADPDTTIIFHALAAFPSGSSPRLKALAFGIEYDSERLDLVGQGTCAGFELADNEWPTSGSGTALVLDSLATGSLTEVYWFAAYAAVPGDTCSFALRPHPIQGGQFADDAIPAVLDSIADYGRLGLGIAGYLPCPSPSPDGPDGPDEPEGEGDTPLPPVSPVLVPSIDTAPFHKVDIYADQAGTSGFVWNHWSSFGYPTFLRNSSLLVVRDYEDTVAVCNSYANDHLVLGWSDSQPAKVRFRVNPPRLATSLYLLSMVDVATPGDGGDPIGLVTLTDENAQTLTDTLSIGSELRCAWKHDCEADLYAQHPTDPLCGEIWRDSHEYGDSAYYDVQEIALPTDWRSRQITEIEISQHVQHDYCCRHDCIGGIVQTSLVFSGASLGTDFHIVTANGDSVVTQRQDDTAWTSHPYGGRLHNGQVLGTWRTIGEMGCYLTCVSMASNYYGVTCDPGTLNRACQDSLWYNRTFMAVIDSVAGQTLGSTVYFRVTDNWQDASTTSDRLVLRHKDGVRYDPVAIIQATPGDSASSRSGVIDQRFASADSVILPGDHLECYGFVSPQRATSFGGGQYSLRPVSPGSPDAVEVIERAMADDFPVFVYTFVDTVPVHWVVADGMKTHWDGGGGQGHRGTYSIHDPGSDRLELLATPYDNRMAGAMIAEAANPITQGSDRRLVISLAGAGTLGIIDPVGHTLRWDSETGDYETNIEGLTITPAFSLASLGSGLPIAAADIAEISAPVEGNYLVQANETGGGGFTLDVGAYGGAADYRSAGAFTQGGEGDGSYLVSYVADADSALGFEAIDPASVDDRRHQSTGFQLRVTPNPAVGRCEIALGLTSSEKVTVTMFDVSGRFVAEIVEGMLPAGIHRLDWDGVTKCGERARSGVYFVQLRSERGSATRKLVYLR